MKPYYHVHMFDLGVPVSAQDPNPRGADVKCFDTLAGAQAFAEEQKDKWRTVRVCEMTFEEIERYQEGRKYKIDEIR